MEARAVSKYVRSSPRKMRIIVDVVRGMPVTDALNTLHFMPHRAARWVETTIQSAVHNLIDQYDDVRIDEGEVSFRGYFRLNGLIGASRMYSEDVVTAPPPLTKKALRLPRIAVIYRS